MRKKNRKRDVEGGEDEKTWEASFDAVNVQIYVEGQWSTFIRSSFHPASLLACTLLPPHFFLSPTLPLTGFLLSSSSPHPLPLCHSPSFLLFLPLYFPLPVSHLSFQLLLWGRLRLLWSAAITPIGGIGRPQKQTDRSSE